MRRLPKLRISLVAALLVWAGLAAAADRPAKELFGAASLPASLGSDAIGFYSRGCLAGGVALPVDGPHWQAMRLSRNRQWGLPILVDFIEKLAEEAAALDGWPGLLVGDMSQPRGGPMLSGHASHQTGLDVDIWINPMPNRRLTRQEREDIAAVPVVEPGPHEVYRDRWTPQLGRLIRRAALDPRVERIFVAPGIKKRLCETAGSDRAWLRHVRPYWGHHDHFHVRLSCPPNTRCRPQSPPPPGDGCGADLAWWFTDEPYKPAPEPQAPAKAVTLADLPSQCARVLEASARSDAVTMLEAYAANTSGMLPASVPAVQAIMDAAPPEDMETARLPRPRPPGR